MTNVKAFPKLCITDHSILMLDRKLYSFKESSMNLEFLYDKAIVQCTA